MANPAMRGHAEGMKTPPSAGPLFRVGFALFLCAACFQSGRWYQELSGPAQARHDAGNEMVSATFRGEPEPATKEIAPLVSVGDPVGESGDIITPLNVRDPSSLVMGPGGAAICPPAEPVEPPAKPAAPRKLKEGRLLELLKKADKKSGAPKNY
jgi:hypothetical protein